MIMSKTIYEFELPDEAEEAMVASKAVGLYLCLWDLDQLLRDKIKYPDNPDRAEYYQEVRDMLYMVMEGNEVFT